MMATITETFKPPIISLGPIGWMRKNLFSGWFNSLLTIVCIWLIYQVAFGLFGFVINANWKVVTVNLRLFTVGRYPIEEVWRVMVGLSLVAFLLGASWRAWGGIMRTMAITIVAFFIAITIQPFETTETRLFFFANALLMGAGFAFAHFVRARRLIITGWILSPFISAVLIYGVGPLPSVTTDLWGGLLLTFVLAISGIFLSFPLGVLLALGRQSSYPVIKWFSVLYIEIVRGVPLVTVLFTAQIVLPIFFSEGFTIERVVRAIAGFTVFTAAYLAEVVRGGLQSISRGQSEAARAIGLNTFQVLWLIILPQALRAVIPAIVGQFISLFKDTSLVAIVGLLDLTGIAAAVTQQRDFLGLDTEVLLFIAVIYFVCCFAMTYASRRLEKRLGVGER
jgi:general L-amino acid transport system permease protein